MRRNFWLIVSLVGVVVMIATIIVPSFLLSEQWMARMQQLAYERGIDNSYPKFLLAGLSIGALIVLMGMLSAYLPKRKAAEPSPVIA